MTYATQQNMIDRYGAQEILELTDRGNTGTIDQTVLGQALADADSEMNAYLESRYTLPFASVPPVLTRFACDIARYQLYDTRAPDQVKARYDAAIKFLGLVNQGAASLGLDPVNVPVADAGSVRVNAAARIFNKNSLADFNR